MQVMSMFEKAEKEYLELLSKKKIVEQDKMKVWRTLNIGV